MNNRNAGRSKFTESQILFAIKQSETGVKVDEVCRKMGISEATFYNWNRVAGRKKYGGLGVSELQTNYPMFIDILYCLWIL